MFGKSNRRLSPAIREFGGLACAVILVIGCRAPAPRPADEAVAVALARLNRLLGVTARSYNFDLRPREHLVVRFHAQKNGKDEPGNTFEQVITSEICQKFNRNYPTFEPLEGKRLLDIEILQPPNLAPRRRPSEEEAKRILRELNQPITEATIQALQLHYGEAHRWDLDQVKVSVRLPSFERYFVYDDPVSSSTEFSTETRIVKGTRNALLKLDYRERNGDARELTVEAEIIADVDRP